MLLLVIADDFTGALDTGVQFTAYGCKTKVTVDKSINFSSCDSDVLVIDTETRHLGAKEAYQIVEDLTKRAVKAGVRYIYKKTDSALRGNIGAELGALLNASGEKFLPFLPAFPQMNRITKEGIHYIDGVPVNESAFGKDPFEPVQFAKVTDLIASQSNLLVENSIPLSKEDDLSEKEGIIVFDAECVEDFKKTGEVLCAQDALHIMAGCAGFGEILPQLFGMKVEAKKEQDIVLDEKFLVICGSVHPVTVAQLGYAERNGFSRMRLAPEQKLETGYWKTPEGDKAIEQIFEMLAQNDHCIIETNDEDANQSTARYAEKIGINIDIIRERIANCLGQMVDLIFKNPNVGTMLLTGGDTLLECMKHLGIGELEPLCEVKKGAVLVRITKNGLSRYVITKSGGFGEEDLMVDIANQLKNKCLATN